MATIRVHEDQENRIDARRFGKDVSLQQQNKRAVLGLLHNNFVRTAKGDGCKDEINKAGKNRNYFLPANIEPFKIYEEKTDEVPFQIYEDNAKTENSIALREPLNENSSTSTRNDENLREKSEGNQLSIKLQAQEQQHLQQPQCSLEVDSILNVVEKFNKRGREIEDAKQINSSISKGSPMSLEKSLQLLTESAKKESRFKRETCRISRSNLYEVDEYRADIFNYFRSVEGLHRPKPGYMKKQPDITHSMRTILVDWLVEVAEEYRLHTETLYLAISYIDRFLSYMSVVRAKLQLVGTAAMFIAAKYEEIYPPEVGEFVYITDDTYTKKQVLRMEHLILRVLSFDLTVPTPLAFLMEYCLSNNLSEKVQYLAMYLCELSLLEADPYLKFLPSHLAASAVALARHTLREEVWPHELELSTGYSLSELRECIACLTRSFRNAPNMMQQAIQEKYKSNKYGHVALLLPRSTETFTCDDDSESA